jgi:hypothetical protein
MESAKYIINVTNEPHVPCHHSEPIKVPPGTNSMRISSIKNDIDLIKTPVKVKVFCNDGPKPYHDLTTANPLYLNSDPPGSTSFYLAIPEDAETIRIALEAGELSREKLNEITIEFQEKKLTKIAFY